MFRWAIFNIISKDCLITKIPIIWYICKHTRNISYACAYCTHTNIFIDIYTHIDLLIINQYMLLIVVDI